MKIKKISDDKVQIIITNQDLEDRDFKKWELMPLSPKVQELFQDLLDMAYQECGFEIEDDSQLLVEAYPLSIDSFVIVMTKVRPHLLDSAGIYTTLHDGDEETELERVERTNRQVWAFSDLEICSQVCSRLIPDYIEKSSLYKFEDAYYLSLEILPETQLDVEALLGEYGDWVPWDEVFLSEHGRQLISREAVVNLASLIR
jgi:adapter protein MecA 1/2